MKRYVLVLVCQVFYAQSNYPKLAKDFVSLPVLYQNTSDYFPKIGYDDVYGIDLKFEPQKGGILKEVTANFKANFENYYEYSRYFPTGKPELKNTKVLLNYEVQKSNKNSGLKGIYEMIILNKNNKIIAHKYIAGHNHVEHTFMKPKLILDSWQQSQFILNGTEL